MMGSRIESYISSSNGKNRKLQGYIETLNSKSRTIDNNLKGKLQANIKDAIRVNNNRIEVFIGTRRALVPILEETIYWEKEYKRRADAEKESEES